MELLLQDSVPPLLLSLLLLVVGDLDAHQHLRLILVPPELCLKFSVIDRHQTFDQKIRVTLSILNTNLDLIPTYCSLRHSVGNFTY